MLHDARLGGIRVKTVVREWIRTIKTTGEAHPDDDDYRDLDHIHNDYYDIHDDDQNGQDQGHASSSSEQLPGLTPEEKQKDVVEDELVVSLQNNNPRCYFFMDSYYVDQHSRKLCVDNNMRYSSSVKQDRFSALRRRVLPEGYQDRLHNHFEIFNKTTDEVFMYVYDDVDVGVKYNLSRGFKHTTVRSVVAQNSGLVPIYSDYKNHFGKCDLFNKQLHGRTWPFKRGGHGVDGEKGAEHDFIVGTILLNTINAAMHINDKQYLHGEFYKLLADQIFEKSLQFP
jgi:hypothetical protein